MIRQSCIEHQKSHRKHRQIKKNSGHRVTSCSRNCLNFILQARHKNKLKKNCFQYQVKGAQVTTRTAKLCSEQGSTDLSEIMVIDELILCKKDTMQKNSLFAHVE